MDQLSRKSSLSDTIHSPSSYEATLMNENSSISSSDDDKNISNNNTSPAKTNVQTRTKEKDLVTIWKLFSYATRWDKAMIILAWVCSIIVGVLQPSSIGIFASSAKDMADAMSSGKSLRDATMPAVFNFLLIGTGILVIAYVANCLWIISGERQTRRIRELYIHAILRQDMAWFDHASDGSLTTRLASDAQLIQDGISEKCGGMIRAITSFIAGIAMAFGLGWRIAIVVLATLPLLAGVAFVTGSLATKSTRQVQDAYAEAGSVAEQVFTGIRTVYSFSMQHRFCQLFNAKLAVARQQGEYRGIVNGLGYGVFLFVLFGIFGLANWQCGQVVKNGELEGWRAMAAFFGMIFGSMSLLQVPGQLAALSTARGAAYKIFNTIDRVPEIDLDSEGGILPKKIEGNIEFRNVKFSYPTRPDVPVLRNLSLNIQPGSTVAFVGPSGSGKSTAVQLIQRFYDTCAGQILVDGHDIRDLNLKWLRQQIGVVSQEPVLFNMTIRQNLLLCVDHKVSNEEIIRACKQANCHGFISKLPNGYETIAGEHGGMMSGGQKQRIAIARAILKNPAILLLDEATSALDTRSERLVQTALDAASANRTTIVIAHRLSTIRNADLIVVMRNGMIVEVGNHSELLQRKGVYTELVNKQQITTEKDKVESAEDDDTETEEEREEKETVCDDEDLRHVPEEEPKRSVDLVSMNTVVSIDAYEVKRLEEKKAMKLLRKQKVPIRKIIMEMRGEWSLLTLGTAGAMLAGAVHPVSAYIFAKYIAALLSDENSVAPDPLSGTNLYGFLFGMFGVAALLGFGLEMSIFEIVGERYTERLRSKIFKSYLKQEIGYYDNHTVGALTAKLAVDARNVNELVTTVPRDVVHVISTAVAGFVVSFFYSWKLSLILLAMSPVVMGSSFYESQVQRGFEDKTVKAHEQSGQIAGEAVREIRTVASLNKQSHFEAKYQRALERPHRLAIRKAFMSSMGYALSQGFILYAAAVAFYVGIDYIEDGSMEFESLFICLLCIMITVSGIGSSSVFMSTFARAKNSAVASYAILERPSAIDPDLEGVDPPEVKGDIGFNNIVFRYPSRLDIPIFNGDFCFGAKAGTTVALVGPSGCGKSTTIGMLQRWYDPCDGAVRLDGTRAKNYTLANLRSHMAVVGQEPILFDMSIGENIRHGVHESVLVTQDQIEAAAKAANIHQFIKDLPNGYHTRVGDKGSQLSGGQKQRIAIARALIRQPKVLLLDEATSALDSESEKLVQAAIDSIVGKGGRTIITIAHRLSTIQNSDLICFVKDGRVVEQGSHWELLKMDGEYAALVRQQSLTAF
ncbi:P-loop containing nucleoside triphosphate hydrolase protein [Dichotomocladium elegans]|nr:P-loop containing nucleoside triphosphate hydrolase protein [Dichotomocladium elegans]